MYEIRLNGLKIFYILLMTRATNDLAAIAQKLMNQSFGGLLQYSGRREVERVANQPYLAYGGLIPTPVGSNRSQ